MYGTSENVKTKEVHSHTLTKKKNHDEGASHTLQVARPLLPTQEDLAAKPEARVVAYAGSRLRM